MKSANSFVICKLFFSPFINSCNLAGISTASPMILSTVSRNLADEQFQGTHRSHLLSALRPRHGIRKPREGRAGSDVLPGFFYSFADLLVGICRSRNLSGNVGMRTAVQVKHTGKVARIAYVHSIGNGCNGGRGLYLPVCRY